MAIRYGVAARRSVLGGLAAAMFVGGLAAAMFVSGTAWAASPESLRLALISPQSRQEMEATWTPIATALGRYLGQPVEVDVSIDYAGAIWNLRSGRAQLAWLGNKSAIEAVDNAGVEVFARETYPSGLGGYYTYLIVPKDSPLTSADDVVSHASDLTFGRGDANSTSGSAVPNYYLFAQRHLEPRKIFKRVVQANHEDNIRAVAERRTDAATVASLVYGRMEHSHPDVTGATRVVWQSPLIPADPLVWRKDLSPELKSKVAAFFLSYGASAPGKSAAVLQDERAALGRLKLKGFTASDNRQLSPIRLLELAKTRMQTEMDETVPPDERSRRLQEIERRTAEIERLSSPTTN